MRKKIEVKVYRTWQKICFVIFGGGIILDVISKTISPFEYYDFSSAYGMGRTAGPVMIWSLILIIVLMVGEKTKTE